MKDKGHKDTEVAQELLREHRNVPKFLPCLGFAFSIQHAIIITETELKDTKVSAFRAPESNFSITSSLINSKNMVILGGSMRWKLVCQLYLWQCSITNVVRIQLNGLIHTFGMKKS